MNLNNALQIAENNHRQGKLTLALTQYKNLIKSYDSNDAIYGLATLYFQQNEYSQAIELFNIVQHREPYAADIALNYALCLQAANQKNKSLMVLNTIVPHIPNDITLVIPLAKLAYSLKSYRLSIKILKLFPTPNQQTKPLLANAYMQLALWSKAQKNWLALTELAKDCGEYWHKLAICSAKMRDYPLAIKAFSTFIALSKQHSTNHVKFADLYLMARKSAEAKKQLAIAITLGDVSLARYELETKIYRLEHNIAKAINAADKALAINAENYVAWKVKSELAKQHSACISSLAHLATATLVNNFQNQQNLFTLAKSYEATENYRQAFQCFEQANLLQDEVLKNNNLAFDNKAHHQEYQNFAKVMVKTKPTAINSPLTASNNIFIVGMPRSGTTLVERLLGQCPAVQSIGESEALPFAIGHPIDKYQQDINFDWSAYFEDNAIIFQQKYQQETLSAAKIIVDKMPHNFRYVGAIAAIFSQVKIIQMRRNPQDLALSIFSQPFALEHNYASKLSAIAHAIFHANKLMDFWAQEFPQQVININYEQLAQTPNQVAEKLFKFCQLPWQQEYLNFYQKNVASFTFSELQVRQAINTRKINFSAHYNEQLAEFNQTYNTLVLAEK